MSEPVFPVTLTYTATVRDPESGEVLETIEVDGTRPAPIRMIGIELDQRGYSELFTQNGQWAVTRRGARRI